jgi:hypothetical protein
MRTTEPCVNTAGKLTPFHRVKIDPPGGLSGIVVARHHPPQIAVLEPVAVALQ